MPNKKVFLLSAFIIINLASCNNIKSGFAKIQVDNIVNLGKISILDTVRKTIFIKNKVSTKLKIDSIASSCGCTIVSFDKSFLSKNDSSSINIEFIPNGLGKFNEQIIIDANTDPPFTTISLIGEIE